MILVIHPKKSAKLQQRVHKPLCLSNNSNEGKVGLRTKTFVRIALLPLLTSI